MTDWLIARWPYWNSAKATSAFAQLLGQEGGAAMAPYRHFEDKAALMGAVALKGFAMLEAEAARANEATDSGEALTAQGLADVGFARAHPALFRLMFADGAGLGLPHEDCHGAYALMTRQVAELAPNCAHAGALAC